MPRLILFYAKVSSVNAIFDGLLYIRLYLFFTPKFLFFIIMVKALTVSVILSIFTVSVLLPSSESVSTYRICTNANNKHPY